MKIEHHNYDSYLKDGAMHSVKATLILSLTTLILLASYIAYNSHQDRFALLPIQADKSIYVFDRKNNTLNYCTSDNQCKLIKLNLPVEQVSTGSMLPASLQNILDGKNNKGKEDANASKKPAAQKGAVTVTATQAASEPVNQAKKPALVPADIRTPPMPAMPAPPMPAPLMPVPAMPSIPEATVVTPPPAAAPTPNVSQAAAP
jgi:hypothetical protein